MDCFTKGKLLMVSEREEMVQKILMLYARKGASEGGILRGGLEKIIKVEGDFKSYSFQRAHF